jgi:saccharopine dehydrogenase (NADP+, L-glutamate forming)
MLPGDWHVPLAELAIDHKAHFVSSSYIAPEMQALNDAALAAGVSLVNEVGLDPGIDHLMAHALMDDYRAAGTYDAADHISFTSYCGGLPKTPNPFRYKFSWSPLGVLKALRSPSRSIRNYVELRVNRPWVETLSGPTGEARLKVLSDQFWNDHAYDDGEPDRVILCVDLKAENDGAPVWHKTYVLDAWGDERGTAMARLVSVTVALAVEAVLGRSIAAGVHAAPNDPRLVTPWMEEINQLSQHLEVVDHLCEN